MISINNRQQSQPSSAIGPTQLEFPFMREMRPQLSPAAAAREFSALRKVFGGTRSSSSSAVMESDHA